MVITTSRFRGEAQRLANGIKPVDGINLQEIPRC